MLNKFLNTILLMLISISIHSQEDQQILIKNLANIFSASKNVVFKNQKLINQKGGDKTSLFGKLFILQLQKEYQLLFKKPLPVNGHHFEKILIKTILSVMEDNRTLIEDKDIGFKGLIAATFAFQLSHKFSERNIGVKIKFTAPHTLVRNTLNSPDSWETENMNKIQKKLKTPFIYEKKSLGKSEIHRFLMPVFYNASCLKCHGTPNLNPLNLNKASAEWTNLDITGFKMENKRLNEFAGAISVVISKGTK